MTTSEPLGPAAPTAPIAIAGGAANATNHLSTTAVELSDAVLERLAAHGSVTVDAGELAEASRDWWPLAMTWAVDGQIPARAGAVVKPADLNGVAQTLAICNDANIPATAAAGRSGVCGGSIPVFGGVLVDLTNLTGIRSVDAQSNVVDVAAGTFGDHFEDELRTKHGLTVGHWPQSMALSTVGGWLACRGAGQLSTRYGKIEDMVIGMDVALADGRIITTGGNPRAAAGPDLTQLFVGSEGTLGVIGQARLRAHPVPPAELRATFSFASFETGLDACRRILQRGATPAVLRLYDAIESKRNFELEDRHALVVIDEGDPAIIGAVMAIVDEECQATDGVRNEDVAMAEQWLGHRNNVDALESLITAGFVVDTMEITGPWSALDRIYADTLAAIRAVESVRSVSAHQSHAYPDGACLYFTFGGDPDAGDKDRFYQQVWDAGTRCILERHGSLSHHHGVGLNRSRFMAETHGDGQDVLQQLKDTLDPNGILNPGKLGFTSPHGPVGWPT